MGEAGQVCAEGVRNSAKHVVAQVKFSQILQGKKRHWDRLENVAVRQKFVHAKLSVRTESFVRQILSMMLCNDKFIKDVKSKKEAVDEK